MIFNRNFVLMFSFLTAQPLVFASPEKTFFTGEHNQEIEKKFVRAFNEFKKTAPNYPTAEEAEKVMRGLVSDLHVISGPEEDEVATRLIIQYLDNHPRLLKQAVRLKLFEALLRKSPDLLEENAKAAERILENSEPESQEELNSAGAGRILENGEPESPEVISISSSSEDGAQASPVLDNVSNESSGSKSFNAEVQANIPLASEHKTTQTEEKSPSSTSSKTRKSKISRELKALGVFKQENSGEAQNSLSPMLTEEKSDKEDLDVPATKAKSTPKKKLTKEERLARQLG